MKKRYTLKTTVYGLLLFLCLSVLGKNAYGQEPNIKKEILVYIAADSLVLPTGKMQNASLNEVSFISNRLREAFQKMPFQTISKTFLQADKSGSVIQNEDGIKIKKPNWERVFTIQLANEAAVSQAIERLKKEPSVVFAEPHSDMKLHTDGLYPQQWHLNNTGQTFGTPDADIDAPEAWQIFTGSSSVKLAVVDTGVETGHDDLSGKSSGDAPESYPYNDYAHGTHVAGIAGAKFGGGDVRGVDNGTRIISKKVFSGYRFDSQAGRDVADWAGDVTAYNKITDAVDSGADVLNHSYGGSQFSTVLGSAFAYAYKMNRVSVASMGNEATSDPRYPAAYSQGIIAVGNTNRNDQISASSSTGNHIDVAAPGSSILSTWLGNGYNTISGTSMAAPVVSGIATLLKGYNPALYNDDIEQLIRISADEVAGMAGQEFTTEYGHGRVNAHKALQRLQSPYVLNHHTASGGTVTNTINEPILFYDTPGLLGGPYIVKRYEVHKTVSFPWMDEVHVWGRGVATNGYSAANPNFAMGWNEPVSVSNNSATLRTFVYEVFTYGSITRIGWFPTSPSNVTFAYTVHGIPGTPPPPPPPPVSVSLSGPASMSPGATYMFSPTVSDGVPPYYYQWYYRNINDPLGSWTYTGIQTSSYMHTAGAPDGDYVKVLVTDSTPQSDEAQHYVFICNFCKTSAGSIPKEYMVENNYPNPFNPSTQIKYALPEAADVTITVYNIMGQEVRTLVNGTINAGYQEVVFDASNLSSGMYIARITAIGNSGAQFSQTLKMQLVK